MTDFDQVLTRVNAERAAERHDRLTQATQDAPRGYKMQTAALLSKACLDRMACELAVQLG